VRAPDAVMEIIMLGTGTSIPHPDMASPGVCVRTKSSLVLFDLGSGALKRLAEAGVSYLDVGHVVFTHYHPDHTGDLVPLLFSYRNPFRPRTTGLTVIGPPGLVEFYGALCGVYGPFVEAREYELELVEHREPYETEEFLLEGLRVRHTESSLAYRFSSGGKTFVVSGDTGPFPRLAEFSRGADLAIFECSFRDDAGVEGHLTPETAGALAEEAGVPRLVLTHFYPVFDGYDIAAHCRKAYGGEVVIGKDLSRIRL
jgi:ribonuclease BN (tRNA processing enzyme)